MENKMNTVMEPVSIGVGSDANLGTFCLIVFKLSESSWSKQLSSNGICRHSRNTDPTPRHSWGACRVRLWSQFKPCGQVREPYEL